MAYRTAEIVTGSAHAPDTLQGMNAAIDGLWRRSIDGPAAVMVDFLEQTHDVGRIASTPDRPMSRNDQQASLLGVARFADVHRLRMCGWFSPKLMTDTVGAPVASGIGVVTCCDNGPKAASLGDSRS